MDAFRHGRVLFAGDAAHQVSPFGARGANSGIQDTDNLVWKLKLVMDGLAPDRLLDTYSEERVYAADENILNSTRSTDFITPKSKMSRTFRDAALELAEHHPFARRLVNSGRLSVPATLRGSALNTHDTDVFLGAMVPGAPAADAPVVVDGRAGWFLDCIGNAFCAVLFADGAVDGETRAAIERLAAAAIPVRTRVVALPGHRAKDAGIEDRAGDLAKRYDARPGTCYLFRPDQHVAARWRTFGEAHLRAAVSRATGNADAAGLARAA
jgi:3-(3-hydroxy-phenyl)propionate hydroxylase